MGAGLRQSGIIFGVNLMEIQAKHIIVHGRVQGVGFRYFVREAGMKRGLKGDTRNCPDGTVEIIVEGGAVEIGDFLKDVERGPALSRVKHMDVADISARGSYDSFFVEGC